MENVRMSLSCALHILHEMSMECGRSLFYVEFLFFITAPKNKIEIVTHCSVGFNTVTYLIGADAVWIAAESSVKY